MPLAIVLYIDGSFIKQKIPLKPIYITVRNLNSVVSGKACAWRVLGMMPSLRKSATLAQTDTWRKDCRLKALPCGLTVKETTDRKKAARDERLKRGWETRRQRKADKA